MKQTGNKDTAKAKHINKFLFKRMLTAEKRQEITELLSRVNIKQVCLEVGVSRVCVYRVLNGTSQRVEDLRKVVERARELVAKKEKLFETI